VTGVIIAAVIAFIVVSIVLARSTSSRKKQAMASLEEERKAVGRYSIVDLVDAEVSDLGLRSIAGAEGIAPDVLLKTWADTPDVHDCERDHMRYELAPGIAPGDADVGDVTLVCDSHGSSNAGTDEPDGGTEPDGSEPTA
jgi:mannitol-specific phosphotransferase system IIBC component